MTLLPPCSEPFKRSLQRATSAARAKGRTHPGPQDLLIALIEDEDAAPVMQACGIDLKRLQRDVEAAGASDPTTGLGHLLQRAFNEAQLSERTVVTGADMVGEQLDDHVGAGRKALRRPGLSEPRHRQGRSA